MDNEKMDLSMVENHAQVAAGGPLQFHVPEGETPTPDHSVPNFFMVLDHLRDPGSLVFHVSQGKEVFRVLPSGKVQIAEGIETDEAAKAFWDAVERLGNPAREKISQLEEELARVKATCLADERDRVIDLCDAVGSMCAGRIAEILHVRIDRIHESLDLWSACARYIMDQIRVLPGLPTKEETSGE